MEECRRELAVGVLVILSTLLVRCVYGKPFPAPLIPDYCNSEDQCCMPRPYMGKPQRQFEYDTSKPIRVRRPAHFLDEEYIAKLELGVALQKALPDTDPRSFRNQMKLHCLYCNNGIYYPNMSWPLEIHGGWHFLPWHRMFVLYNELILGKLLGDDTFAMPYWNWDNQTPEAPFANILPYMYARNKSSSLWNKNRNNCSQPPYTVDLTNAQGCKYRSPENIRVENNRLMYTQLVTGAPTPDLFFGLPYSYGDAGAPGSGTFEDAPHGSVHFWMADPNPENGKPFQDMGTFATAARDPAFYGHHTNVDRLWTIWKSLGGKHRKESTHPDFLDAQYTLYDENGDLITVNVSQTLNTTLLGYVYEDMPVAWTTNGMLKGAENNISKCSMLDASQMNAAMGSIPYHSPGDVFFTEAYTFKVARPWNHANASIGTEVLEIAGITFGDVSMEAHFRAYMFHPSAVADTSVGCPEYIGQFNYAPHTGQALYNRNRVWHVALGGKLAALGMEDYMDVVITLAQYGFPLQPLKFSKISIVYDMSGVE